MASGRDATPPSRPGRSENLTQIRGPGARFVEQGQQSRDKFLASGQNVATKGTTVGYYLFRRCEQNQREPITAWEGSTEVSVM
jgi:hypothetical protein